MDKILSKLSVRAQNVLRANEIETVGELIKLSRKDVLRFRNSGKVVLSEIESLLTAMGLHLIPEGVPGHREISILTDTELVKIEEQIEELNSILCEFYELKDKIDRIKSRINIFWNQPSGSDEILTSDIAIGVTQYITRRPGLKQ